MAGCLRSDGSRPGKVKAYESTSVGVCTERLRALIDRQLAGNDELGAAQAGVRDPERS
jgi:hypothetical protein